MTGVDPIPADRTAYVVRPAQPEDMPTIRMLFLDYAQELGLDLSFQGFDDELASLPGCYVPPDGALLLAVDDQDRALGCVGVRPLSDDGVCEMKRLHVRRNARGLGYGKTLALEALKAAEKAGYSVLRLDTLSSMGAAIALYESLGFERIEPYYQSPLQGTIFLQKRLKPSEAKPPFAMPAPGS